MKQLEADSVHNYEKMGDMRFILVKRTETVALFRRERMDGTLFSYEVFIIKKRLKGQALPGGLFEEQDREVYPKGNSFGKTAWEFSKRTGKNGEDVSLARAEFKYNELVNGKAVVEDDEEEIVPVKPSTQVAVTADKVNVTVSNGITYPSGSFTMKDILEVNVGKAQPTLYLILKDDEAHGRVVRVGTFKGEGRGKPAVVYSVVTKKVA